MKTFHFNNGFKINFVRQYGVLPLLLLWQQLFGMTNLTNFKCSHSNYQEMSCADSSGKLSFLVHLLLNCKVDHLSTKYDHMVTKLCVETEYSIL